MTIGIIGAGASGMAAALAASVKKDVEVLLFERQARVGRKLQATGNGRCNLSNIHNSADHYHGEIKAFSNGALLQFSVEDTLAWFRNLGLLTVTEESGKVYPYSDHANSVVDVLRFALCKENIKTILGFEVTKVKKLPHGFVVEGKEESYSCDRVIIACGGLAGTKLGGSMAGYKLLRNLGHHVTKLRPSLVQLKSSWSALTGLKGVRANCSVKILHNGVLFAQSEGELQFTDYGLSGPVIFEISRDVCGTSGDWTAVLDFVPHLTSEELFTLLKTKLNQVPTAEDILTGILHNRLGKVLVQAAGITLHTNSLDINDDQIRALIALVKGLDIALTEPMGMENAQVTAGGVQTCEIDPVTMESLLHNGLFVCGEVLDVDGDCGGYNLQWAWSSGYVAGKHAARCAE